MFKFQGLARPFWILAALGFLVPQGAFAQDRDTQEVLRYVMTDAALAKYKVAMKKLVALPGSRSSCDDEDDSATIAKAVAKIEATPGAKAAITSSGMTVREYVVFTFAILQNGLAAWAVRQPGGKLPPGVSRANVDFINRHAAEIESLPKGADCREDATEHDSGE